MKRGRPKGYSPYTELTYEALGDYVGRKSVVKVSKAWWDALVGNTAETTPQTPSEEEKIEFQIIDLND